ncbi:hypothetical protein [Brassicibacter mesophilus]|uniref:hypothetical protein n=1 Tax=Brassicibacter mesophilus TaxID=745119 RepID=UPI003D1B6359
MKRDPIESTEVFQKVIKKIQPELDRLNESLDKQGYGLGSCHIYWSRKKQMLKGYGIDWKTPAECNPYILFD